MLCEKRSHRNKTPVQHNKEEPLFTDARECPPAPTKATDEKATLSRLFILSSSEQGWAGPSPPSSVQLACCPGDTSQHCASVKPPKTPTRIPIPPLPEVLPPVNLIHRDVIRAWCQQLKLSTKGPKLDGYKRLCEYAYPHQKNFFEGPLDEENVILTLYPVNEEIIEDHQVEPGVSSTSEGKEEALNTNDQVPVPQTNEPEEDCPSSSFRRSVCPLPATLPPINNVSRDTLRYWCQQLKLSTDGQKIEVYRRLQEHAYPEKDQRHTQTGLPRYSGCAASCGLRDAETPTSETVFLKVYSCNNFSKDECPVRTL
ncbi:hypothetical protein JEQ12_001348 [Ovis aries]|uniref:SAP domain-containing protein n=1 Tax=Ovis aries TaxID=9940 RepID=A0A836APT9_SHEEP|nr:hypothetical protein JEQ12_001348 [Ovis aries]